MAENSSGERREPWGGEISVAAADVPRPPSGGFHAYVSRRIEAFVPGGPSLTDHSLRRRARMVVVFAWAGLPFWILFGLVELARGHIATSLVAFAGGALAACVPWLLRATGAPLVAGNALAGLLFAAVLTGSLLRGGFPFELLALNLIIPMSSLLLMRRRVALAWTCLIVVELVVLHQLSQAGILATTPADPTGVLFVVLALLGLVATFGLAYDMVRQRIERENERLETQLERVQRLESLVQMASGVSHEFNNILTVIQGYATLLLEELGQNSPFRNDIKEIEVAARHGAELTRQLVAFTRSQPGQPERIDLNGFVRSIQPVLRNLASDAVQLDLDLSDETEVVCIDRALLSQTVINLVMNAIEAMPGGGRLGVSTARVTFRADGAIDSGDVPPGSFARLVVSDTGHGIAPEVLDRVFEPFYTTKEPGRGTGLGLSAAYGIVRQAGGYIHVYSEVGKGTSLKVYLPIAPAEHANGPSARAGRTGPQPVASSLLEAIARPATILVVDDQRTVARAMARPLSRAGYSVRVAQGASDALEIWSELGGRVDLLISDVVMPEMSGPELAKRLRAERPNLHVLYISGYPRDQVEHLHPHRGGALLQKPFAVSDLLQVVAQELATNPPS